MKEINLNKETIIDESLTLNKILHKFMIDYCNEKLTNLYYNRKLI